MTHRRNLLDRVLVIDEEAGHGNEMLVNWQMKLRDKGKVEFFLYFKIPEPTMAPN